MTVKETIARYDFNQLIPLLRPIIFKPRVSLPVLQRWYETLQKLEPSGVVGRQCHAMWRDDNFVTGQPREYGYVTSVEGDFWRDILASEFSWDEKFTETEALAWLIKCLSPDCEPFGSVTG